MHDKLSEKLLKDFHGNAPTVNNTLKGTLPNLTKKAKVFVAQRLKENEYFRFGINGGGCSGFQYTMTNDATISEKDVLFSESPRAVVDKESLNYVWGSTIDLSGDKFSASLTVDNPCAKMSCGCGTSFNFDPKFLEEMEKKDAKPPVEIDGPSGLEPTRYGDWERKGIAYDF